MTIDKRQSVLSLILMEENKDDLITQGKSASDKITDKLFNDLMH